MGLSEALAARNARLAAEAARLDGLKGPQGDAGAASTVPGPKGDPGDPATATTSATDLTSGTLDGNRLPAFSTTKKAGVPATGTPSGKFLKDDGTWAAAGGGAHAGTHVTGGGDVIADAVAAGNSGLMSGADKTKINGIAAGANVGVVPNAGITGAAKTKITYDAKGLVTSGADATTADIADSTNARYCTDAQKTVIGNTSGTNSGDNVANSLYSGLAASKENTGVAAGAVSTHAALATGVHGVGVGTIAKVSDIPGPELPSQTGNGSKYLTTDGSTPSWATPSVAAAYGGVNNAPASTLTLAANYSFITCGKFALGSGVQLVLGAGAIFKL